MKQNLSTSLTIAFAHAELIVIEREGPREIFIDAQMFDNG